MTFVKAFAKGVPGSRYPDWIEVALTQTEEEAVEQHAQQEHIVVFKSCLKDARKLFADEDLKDYQTDLINTAIALFEKRASHSIYHKEEAARKKFDASKK